MRDLVARATAGRAPCLATIGLAGALLLALLVPGPQSEAAAVKGGLAAAPTSAPPGYAPDLPGQIDISGPGSASAAAIDGKGLRKRLSTLTRRAGSATGVWVADLGKKKPTNLYTRKASQRRILASNEKLFTTAASLDHLGANSRISTRVFRKGPLTDGRLAGDLFLVGAGDPALSSRNYAAQRGLPHTAVSTLASRLRKAGIRRVTGKIRADESAFDRRRGVPDSNWKYSPFIGASLSGLTYNPGQNRGDPARAAAVALKNALRKEGVTVKGAVAHGTASRAVLKRDPIAQVRSAPLSELVKATNKTSNNFYAETLLKGLAAESGKGTTRRGSRLVQRFAKTNGSGVEAVDGSGLTRANRASPREVGRLLATMDNHKAAQAFDSSLAIAGQDGTLAGRMGGTRAAGRCRGKTGTLSGVSALSGYCDSGNGVVAFSILMNDTETTKARKLQDRMTVAIARYRD